MNDFDILANDLLPDTLEGLFDAMRRCDPLTLDSHGAWRTDLPTYSDAPTGMDLTQFWSWDVDHVLVGTCPADLEIQTRNEYYGGDV